MTSTNFTFNNTVYTANDKMTYFYRWPEGRKGERVRIKKADFESAYNQFVEAENARQNAANEFTNIDPLPKYAVIDGERTNANAGNHILVVSVSDDLDMIKATVSGEFEEVVAVFERDDQIYYSRHLDNPTREFKGHIEDLKAAKVIEIDPLLKAAEDPAISVEEYCEMIEESETTEETKEIVKAKKSRKSKDIAYTYSENGETVVTLTAKQVDFVKHLPDTCFWENGLESCIWVDCLCDEISGQFAGKPMTVGAMISTLCEKGLGIRGKQKVNGRKCTSFELTDLGMKVFAGAEWGLE